MIPIDGPSSHLEPNSDSRITHNHLSSGSNLIQQPPSHYSPRSCGRYTAQPSLPCSSASTLLQYLQPVAENPKSKNLITIPIDGPPNHIQPNSVSGIDPHHYLSSDDNMIQHRPYLNNPRHRSRYGTMYRSLHYGSASSLLEHHSVAPNPKSKNIITIPIDGPPNNFEPNSDSGSVHNNLSFVTSLIHHPPSHTDSEIVSVRAISSESATGGEIFNKLLAQSTTMGENTTTIQSPVSSKYFFAISVSFRFRSFSIATKILHPSTYFKFLDKQFMHRLLLPNSSK